VKQPRKPRTIGYRQIAAALIGDIQAGAVTPGAAFPTEMQLVARFGVGRNTVREALRELQEQGYLRRRRGARSILATEKPDHAFVNSVRSAGELLDYARTTKLSLLTTETIRADPALGILLDVEAGTEWLRLGLLRSRDGHSAPFCYSEVYIAPAYGDVVDHFGSESELFSIIERLHGIVVSRIEQEIEATAVDANIASRLNVRVGSACLRVRTKFFSSSDELIEIGVVHFPAGRYKVRLSLDRKSGA